MIREKKNSVEVTVLSKGVKLLGEIETNSDLLIEGEILGSVLSNGKVIITKDGYVKGNVTANSVELFGKCDGDIHADAAVVIGGTSLYKGRVACATIEIQKGAVFMGDLKSINNNSSEDVFKEESKVLNIKSLSKPDSILNQNLIINRAGFELDNGLNDEPTTSQAYW
jgi:cytoskeletal protein CcmA (bactofilin family)